MGEGDLIARVFIFGPLLSLTLRYGKAFIGWKLRGSALACKISAAEPSTRCSFELDSAISLMSREVSILADTSLLECPSKWRMKKIRFPSSEKYFLRAPEISKGPRDSRFFSYFSLEIQ